MYQHRWTETTRGQGLYEITTKVQQALADSGLKNGLVNIFCRHTSCSLVLMENADPSARRDLERWLEDDLKGLLWPMPYSFFTDMESDLSEDNWLATSWLGHANVTHFPWTYLPSLQTYLYLAHQSDTGSYWFYDQELGWAHTTDTIWPYFFSTEDGWGYFRPGQSPLRQLVAGS